jgi:hypothetical protein
MVGPTHQREPANFSGERLSMNFLISTMDMSGYLLLFTSGPIKVRPFNM